MTREDIIKMALEAKSCVKTDHNGVRLIADGLDIERFATLVAQRVLAGSYPEMIALVAAAERERLANARAVGNRAYDRYEGETK